MPVPNSAESTLMWLRHVKPEAVILSGGNDLVVTGGDAPERDATEMHLMEWACEEDLPLLGICRGMQMIATFNGASLEKQLRHAGGEHHLCGLLGGSVPSHHKWCVTDTPANFEVLAQADDG